MVSISPSFAAFEELCQTRKINERQKAVLYLLATCGPMTGPQIGEHIPGGWKRLSELEDEGLVRRQDRGRKPALWEARQTATVPGRIPRKAERKVRVLRQDLAKAIRAIDHLDGCQDRYDCAVCEAIRDWARPMDRGR